MLCCHLHQSHFYCNLLHLMFCHTCLKEEVNPEESTALSMLELQQESRTPVKDHNEERPCGDKSGTTEPGDMAGVIADAQAEISFNTTPKSANSNTGNVQKVCCVAISITLFPLC